MRGNHPAGAHRAGQPGSIPAPAGEPSSGCPSCRATRVYPRACGGTIQRVPIVPGNPGLSPRLRGNHPAGAHRAGQPGSIPAPAGEPSSGCPSCRATRVYPRACGGTIQRVPIVPGNPGLSPRLRGNHPAGAHRAGQPGSIPAPAGEPSSGCPSCRATRVYPRACGEPSSGCPSCRATRVYPRACGGTIQRVPIVPGNPGLSPRLRGNHPAGAHRAGQPGSIPAPAGEPAPPP